MKINNFSNNVTNIILYSGNTETQKTINPYNAKAFFNSKNIFNETIESYDDYFTIIIDNLTECINNEKHINANKKRNNIFIVWIRGKYGDVNGSLYIPLDEIITHEIIEEKKDMRSDGCINVSYNDKIVFAPDIKIICHDSETYFAKGEEPIKNQFESIQELEECIEKETERAKKYPNLFHNCERLLNLYKYMMQQGYKYKVFNYRAIETNYKYLVLYNCVDHYEKSENYIKAEKITEELKKINEHWSVNDTIKLLKSYKLTKTRTKKGE